MSTKYARAMVVIAAAAALIALAVPALSFNFSEESARWEVARQGAPSQLFWKSQSTGDPQAEAAPAVAALADRYGGTWYYQVNRTTGTYHHIYGGSIDLGVNFNSAEEVEALARSFIKDNQGIFGVGSDDLSVTSCTHALGKWAIIFQQTYQGLRVYGGRAHLVFSDDGRLFELGSDAHPGIAASLAPGISQTTALGLAKIAIGYLEETDKVEFSELMVLPVEADEAGMEYRLAYRFDLRTVKPYGLWATWVDAASGEILWRENHIRFTNFTGHVQGDIEWDGYCDGATADYPVADMTVTVSGVGSANTGASGDFTVTYSGTGAKAVTAAFVGPWLNVDRASGTNASHSGTITAGTPYTIDWSSATSLASERDVFAYANKIHDWVKAMDPTFTTLDYQMDCTIERDDYYCPGNAWWDGYGINFCVEDEYYGYGNTAQMGDVVFHEYTHGITQEMYGVTEPGGDVHEGNSDVGAALLTRESIMGLGFFLDECSSGIRDSDNSIQFPCSGDDHYCGQVLSGFYWDAWRELLAGYPQAVADSVIQYNWHFGRKMGLPLTMDNQVHWAFVADDDDANLGNGTPHYNELCVGAANHGFDCPEITVGVFITHAPLSDTQNTTTPYPVTAVITSTAGTIVADSCRVTYRVDGGAFANASMAATANPNEYVGYIPAQPACSKIGYYIYARDNAGNTKTAPVNAPTGLYAFCVGYQTIFADDFETNKGWTAGVTGDDATTGIWERCDPEVTDAQPENDNTASPGVYAYITDCTAGSNQGSYDIDGGKTTLLSPVFDLSDQDGAVVTYYRWYSNDTGAEPGTDYWVVEVTDDNGSTWVSLENTNASDRSWLRMQFNIDAYVDLTNRVRFRFIASDEDPGSLVEAGLDDFSIVGCEQVGDTLAPSVTVLDPNGGESLVGGNGAEFEIAWSASDNVGVVTTRILLSTDGGATYPDTLASGSLTSPWTWVLPDINKTACRIKVVCLDAAINAGSDQSDADFEITGVSGVPEGKPLPEDVVLLQNRPSPFGSQTEIEFGLPGPARVSLRIYGVDGRLVATLAEGAYPGGYHRALWSGMDERGAAVSAGMYFCRLETPGKVLTRKTLVVR
jgi:Zn-dependent metalloprotease